MTEGFEPEVDARSAFSPGKEGLGQASKPKVWVLGALALFTALGPSIALAHGTLHDQIAGLDRRIAERPRDAELYLKRGDLKRRHRDWAASLADLDRAAALDPRLFEVHHARSRTLLDSDRPADAEAALKRYLAALPEEPGSRERRASALLLRGAANRRLGRPADAAGYYRAAVDLATRPGPQAFLDCARAFDAAGAEHTEAALGCLDDGLKRLGPVVSLARFAIELDVRGKHYNRALERLDRLSELSPRDPSWRVERGEILELAGRLAKAREAFREARAAVAGLPAGRRRSPAVKDLEERIAAGLTRTGLKPRYN